MITCTDIYKSFQNNNVFLGLSCEFPDHSFTSIVGPSGCGKSTLLNLLCGIDQPDSGTIQKPPPAAAIGYMMQDPHLLPWRTLGENATLGVEVIEQPRAHDGLLSILFKAFELGGYENVYPVESSGGMKQRAALIRTLLINPKILLLDEPFASLDFDIKLKAQREIVDFHQQTECTTILVTHDIEDAIALSDEVVVLSRSPARIKTKLRIDLGIADRDPVEARKSPKFREYFIKIWDELKYLDDKDEVSES